MEEEPKDKILNKKTARENKKKIKQEKINKTKIKKLKSLK